MDKHWDIKSLKTKNGKVLKQILKNRRVDYSLCVEKSDIVALILKTNPVIKSPKPINQPPANSQPEHNWIPNATKPGYNIPEVNSDLIQQFRRIGLGSHENHDIIGCQEGLKRDPRNHVHWYNMGVHLATQGRMEASTKCYLESIKFQPDFKLPHNNLAAYYKDRDQRDRAIYHYMKAIDSDPNFAIALSNLAMLYYGMGELIKAQKYCKRAIDVEPLNAEAPNNMGTLVLQAGCSAAEAVKYFEKAIELDPIESAGRLGAYSNRLLGANSMPAPCEEALTGKEKDTYNAKLWRYHKEWAVPYERSFDHIRFKVWHNDLNPNRTLRVGYLSTDIRQHPASYFAETPLTCMDDSKVEVYVYLNGPPGDNRTAYIREKIPDHRWRMIDDRSPVECGELFREDKIDILVELGGHACGNRQDIMVLKPAPIQVTYLGYANTTGLSVIDYRITDSIADPPTTHQQYSEELVRMPDPCAFLCYAGEHDLPPCTGAKALKKGYVTFGSFNAIHKLTKQCFELWCRVLNAVPNSRLYLKSKPFRSSLLRKRYIKRFGKKGISKDRLTLKSWAPSFAAHMKLYKRIDICLDPFPYAGTTTSAEALWMGCPFITLQRVKFPIHAQNVGTSFLNRIPGLEKFIAKTKQEYVDKAIYWANHLEELNEIKVKLRENFVKSPLGNKSQFCEKLAEVYRKMWIKYCEQHNAN